MVPFNSRLHYITAPYISGYQDGILDLGTPHVLAVSRNGKANGNFNKYQ